MSGRLKQLRDGIIRLRLAVGLTMAGIAMVVAASWSDGYWESVLIEVGAGLGLFAVLALAEPRLVSRVRDAVREPRNLDEAAERFAALSSSAGPTPMSTRAEMKERVLHAVGKAGLHQESPNEGDVRFRSLHSRLEVEWLVTWGANGVVHEVSIPGVLLPSGGRWLVSWTASFQQQEEKIRDILNDCSRAVEAASSRATGERMPGGRDARW